MADENHTQRFQMRVPSDFLVKIDEWRRQQPDLPNRSEAIRRLVELALRKEAQG
jgi:metal-responsive CopG/Arc/MetJ family transcriptional regulator